MKWMNVRFDRWSEVRQKCVYTLNGIFGRRNFLCVSTIEKDFYADCIIWLKNYYSLKIPRSDSPFFLRFTRFSLCGNSLALTSMLFGKCTTTTPKRTLKATVKCAAHRFMGAFRFVGTVYRIESRCGKRTDAMDSFQRNLYWKELLRFRESKES